MNTEGLTIEERKAQVLIKLRKYKLVEKEDYENAISYLLKIPKYKSKTLVWCFLGGTTVARIGVNEWVI